MSQENANESLKDRSRKNYRKSCISSMPQTTNTVENNYYVINESVTNF